MEKLLEALKNTSLSANQVEEIQKSVKQMVEEAKVEIEKKLQDQYNEKVQEAYDTVAAEIESNEAKAEEGYKQALAIIKDLNLRLEQQSREYEDKMEEGYQQAWEMIQAEQSKRQNVEVEVYTEADSKLKQMSEFMVDKLDQFLQLQNSEIYESAYRDIVNDPKMVEHRIALEKVAEIMSDYLSVEELANANSSKVQEATRQIEDMKGRIQILEHRNINLSNKNKQLTESLQTRENQVNESHNQTVVEDKKNRKNDVGNASGRGKRVIKETMEVIPEFNNPVTKKSDDNQLVEQNQLIDEMLVLSGLKDDED
jgi:hypothetical protein